MSREFQDRDFLVWEVFPSGGRFGTSEQPHLVFHCLTKTDLRPRRLETEGDEADAERRIEEASPAELVDLLAHAREIE